MELIFHDKKPLVASEKTNYELFKSLYNRKPVSPIEKRATKEEFLKMWWKIQFGLIGYFQFCFIDKKGKKIINNVYKGDEETKIIRDELIILNCNGVKLQKIKIEEIFCIFQ